MTDRTISLPQVPQLSFAFKALLLNLGIFLGVANYFGLDLLYLIYFILFLSSILLLCWYKPSVALSIMFLLLPYHTFLMSFSYANMGLSMGTIKILQTWKEIVVIILLLKVLSELYSGRAVFNFSIVDKAIIIYVVFNLIYFVIPVGPDSIKIKLYGLRNDIFFLVLYFVGKYLTIKDSEFRAIVYSLMFLCGVTGVLAFFEKFFTDQDFYVKVGYVIYQKDFFNFTYPTLTGLSYTFWSEPFNSKRVAAFFANPLALANAICAIVPLIFSTLLTRKIKYRSIYVFVLFISVSTLLVAIARGAIIALTFQLLILIVLVFLNKDRFSMLLITTGTIGIILLIGIFSYKHGISFFLYVFSDSSTYAHIIATIQDIMLLEHSLWGHGIGSSGSVSGRFGVGIGSENQFLQVAVETGIAGLLSYLFLILSIFQFALKGLIKATKPYEATLHISVISIFAGIAIISMTTLIWHDPFAAYLSWWAVGYSHHSYYNLSNDLENLKQL